MASIFEELMTANQRLTESVHPAKKKTESRKINCRHLKVESRKFFEENDLDTLEKEFEVPEVTSENPDEIVLVIDPEIQDSEEIPEDAAEEMVGDLVYKCPVCGSNYVCNCDADKAFEEGIEVDEEGTPIECPICGDDADQILVGEIAPADEAEGKEVDLPPQEEDEDLPDEDGNLDNPIEEDLDISVSTDDEGKVDEVVVDEDGETVVDEVVDEVDDDEIVEGYRKFDKDNPGDIKSKDAYCMVAVQNKRTRKVDWKKIEGSVSKILSYIANARRKETLYDYGDIYVNDGITEESFDQESGLKKVCPKCHKDVDYCECSSKKECDKVVKEDFSDDEGETDEIVLEPAVEDAVEDEEESPAVVVKDSNVELVFDEARLESLVRKVLKDNYKGNPSFKVSKVRLNKGVLKVEYVVRRGKSSKKGILVGEGFNTRTRVFKVSFRDKGAFTESFGRTPAFVVEMVRVRNKFIPTKMTYDYRVKVNESLYQIKGSVNSGK